MFGRLFALAFFASMSAAAVAQPFNLRGSVFIYFPASFVVDSVGAYARVELVPYIGSFGGRLDCDKTRIVVLDHVIDAIVTVRQGEPQENCEFSQTLDLGKLALGTWELRVSASGWMVPPWSYPFEVVSRGTVCNANPANNTINLGFVGDPPGDFVERLASDASWRVALGNPVLGPIEVLSNGQSRMGFTFDALADPMPILDALHRSGYFLFVGWSNGSCGFATCPGDTNVQAIEYQRTDRDRFIFVTDPAERDALDAGAIAGWSRTGESMAVVSRPGNPTVRDGIFHPVYRFWGGSVTREPSHFFTADQHECAVLRDRPEWNWTYERAGFWAYEWKPEGCRYGIPLYRTYNNGLDGAPAHRYSTKRSVIDEMLARGWVDEGPVMCVAGP